METKRYGIYDAEDVKLEDHQTFEEAKRIAEKNGRYAVKEETYEYTDSRVCWTPDGSDTWPPPAKSDPDLPA